MCQTAYVTAMTTVVKLNDAILSLMLNPFKRASDVSKTSPNVSEADLAYDKLKTCPGHYQHQRQPSVVCHRARLSV